MATSAFACQAEFGHVAAFGLPGQRKKHWGGVKGSLYRASPTLDPAPVLLEYPETKHPCFPSNSDGHYRAERNIGGSPQIRKHTL